MDTSFLDAIKKDRKKRRNSKFLGLSIFIILLVLMTYIIFIGFNRTSISKHVANNSNDKSLDLNNNLTISGQQKIANDNSNNSNIQAPSTVNTPTVKANIQDSKNAISCAYIGKNAIQQANNYGQMFIDGWKDWNQTYVDEYDTQTAKDSEAWDKNYIKNLMNNLISSTDQLLKQSNCPPPYSQSFLPQPGYDSWP